MYGDGIRMSDYLQVRKCIREGNAVDVCLVQVGQLNTGPTHLGADAVSGETGIERGIER